MELQLLDLIGPGGRRPRRPIRPVDTLVSKTDTVKQPVLEDTVHQKVDTLVEKADTVVGKKDSASLSTTIPAGAANHLADAASSSNSLGLFLVLAALVLCFGGLVFFRKHFSKKN